MRVILATLVCVWTLAAAPTVFANTTPEPSLELRAGPELPFGAHGLSTRPAPARSEPGLYLGTVYVEGTLAARLRHLPSKMRRVLGSSVGATPLNFDNGNTGAISFGLGAYLRF